MGLKYVYALISGEQDYYVEQTLISMYSLRRHNPDGHIVLVADNETIASLRGNRAQIKEYIDEYVAVTTPEEFTAAQKSRFIKTSLRQNVNGDFLYLDNDTIVTDSLDELNGNDNELGAVLDLHAPLQISKLGTLGGGEKGQVDSYLRATGKPFWNSDLYYNSGILLVRDTKATHKFFEDWHRIYLDDLRKFNLKLDQPSFAQANVLNNNLITDIDGAYNCQILFPGAAPYFLTPKIIHYFASSEGAFPLNKKICLEQIRNEGISLNIQKIIENPQITFLETSHIIGEDEYEIYRMPMAMLGRKLARDFGFSNRIARFIYRVMGYRI